MGALVTHASSVQYMRLESDGHLRLYEWGGTGWNRLGDVLNVFPDECQYPTVCGEYGICSNGQCSCPSVKKDATFFRQVNERQPDLGCSLVTPLSCQSNQKHTFLPLNNISYFNYIDPDAVAIEHTNEEICKQACLMNCSCKAALFQYGGNSSDGSCYLPSQIFSLKSHDPDIYHFNSSAYVKVQAAQTVPTPGTPQTLQKKSVGAGVIVGFSIGALFAVSVVTGFVIVLIRRRKARELDEEDQFDKVQGITSRFSFEELKIATENFCQKIGGGGFGSVFEGTLSDGTIVAVKRLDGVGQGKKEFLAEVETIGSIHHVNLVRLIGFCAEKSYRLLVYEYMCNGSLDNWIFHRMQDNTLGWQIRRRIITDIAKGLAYLHEECRQKIAHLDIKPQNILLDNDFNAKVSDFGLSRFIDRDQAEVITRMRGTPGYLAPEWLTSIITEKADVYSYGVVIMEIICGRKNLDYTQKEEDFHLMSLLQVKVDENRLSDMIDNHSEDMQQHVSEIIEIMKLAMWCLQSECNKRPSMSAVVKVLEGSLSVESNIDYNFSNTDPLVWHNVNIDTSAPLVPSILSGPR
ncbi:uncharacterized protein A4U43_C01F19310 [Asparagus officinalis]|uniref:non-specific serine/threonine protein kinase n=2 Tax=Asparagus officinalis TaxID=4686 RepID=A0A5P1FV51_ASPOF|nr:uncharacterized protein A4U43_C01F19310 [Asparagus officinalis]